MSTVAPTSMKLTRTDLNACTIQLEITCSPEQFDAGYAKASKEYAKKVKVPGFRPGQAPRAMIEKLIDENELARAAIDEIIRETLTKALKDEDIKPENQPAVNVLKFEKDEKTCTYAAKIPLAPVLKLGNYKGLSVQRPPVEVTDTEVQNQIDDLRNRKGKRAEVTGRGIQEGDMALVNIRPDGETGEGKTFMVVAGQTFADLDKALSGMMVEEIKHAKLKYPATFQEADWAGKSHEATITVRSVSTTQAPDLDDEFAQSLKAADVKDLKEKVRASIERAKLQMSQEMVNEQLFDQLVANSEITVPDTTWEQVASQRLQEMAQELSRQNKSVEDYAKENGMTVEALVAAQQAEAKTQVERAVVIENIFKQEDMKIDNNDANRHFIEIAQDYQVPQDQLSKFAKKFGQGIRNEIVFRAMHTKVVNFLNEHAVEGTAPAKKAKSTEAAPKSKKKATE